MSSSALSLVLSLFSVVFAQPVFEYDGDSIVILQGQYNWTLKYNLGQICEDANWGKTLYIDIHATTSEADLIFAFGTQSHYVAFGMAYDGILWVPLSNDEPKRGGSLFATPAQNMPLQESLISLEEQYARSTDFRDSLITSTNQTAEWSVLQGCYCDNCNSWNDCSVSSTGDPDTCPQNEVKANCVNTPMANNSSQIILEVRGNRQIGETEVYITKNNVTASLISGSTWDIGNDVWLYFGIDAINDEYFQLTRITATDVCSWTPKPTTYAPTQPSSSPTNIPTVIPTIYPTIYPTINPTVYPTINPTIYPTINPTIYPTVNTVNPTKLPTALPTMLPTSIPSNNPSTTPIRNPTRNPTADPSNPTRSNGNGGGGDTGTTTVTELEDDDQDDDTQGDDEGLGLMEGDNAVFVWIGIAIGLVLLLGLLGIAGYRFYKKRKMGKEVYHMGYESNWSSH